MSEMHVGKHTIVVDDSLDYMKVMPEQSIDCVVCSPPYNIGINYHSYHDEKSRDVYMQWISDIGTAIYRVLKPGGSFFLNIGSTNVDPWIQFDVAMTLRGVFKLQNHIIWAKSINLHNNTHGHFKPINSQRFLNHNHEAIFHFTVAGDVPIDRLAIGVPFMDKSNISRRQHAQDRRCGGNIWFIPYVTVQSKTEKFNHPSAYPVELPERCMKLHGSSGVVLDPFLGVGSTLVAAERLGWTGIGIEIDQQYADMAYQRLLNH